MATFSGKSLPQKPNNTSDPWIAYLPKIQSLKSQFLELNNASNHVAIIGEEGAGKSFWIESYLYLNGFSAPYVYKWDLSQKIDALPKKTKVLVIDANFPFSMDSLALLFQLWKQDLYKESKSFKYLFEFRPMDWEKFQKMPNGNEISKSLKLNRIDLPKLKDRVQEIPFFIEVFTNNLISQNSKLSYKNWSDEVLQKITSRSFSRNLTELREFVVAGYGFTKGKEIQFKNLPLHLWEGKVNRLEISPGIKFNEYEKAIIEANLKFFKGNQEKVSKALGISVRNLYRKIEDYQIDVHSFKL